MEQRNEVGYAVEGYSPQLGLLGEDSYLLCFHFHS